MRDHRWLIFNSNSWPSKVTKTVNIQRFHWRAGDQAGAYRRWWPWSRRTSGGQGGGGRGHGTDCWCERFPKILLYLLASKRYLFYTTFDLNKSYVSRYLLLTTGRDASITVRIVIQKTNICFLQAFCPATGTSRSLNDMQLDSMVRSYEGNQNGRVEGEIQVCRVSRQLILMCD